MSKGILGDREKALEDSYFREQDAKLLQSLRKGAALDEIAAALSEKLQVDDPDLLVRAREAGITADTAAAFLVVPLVQVAWAEGSVTKQERSAVLRLAVERGVDPHSPAYSQLEAWLDVRPPDTLFEVASRVIQRGLSVLPAEERDERINRIIDACHEVAAASGSEFARLLGLGDGVSGAEESILDTIARSLRGF
jgi:hypothetical protein